MLLSNCQNSSSAELFVIVALRYLSLHGSAAFPQGSVVKTSCPDGVLYKYVRPPTVVTWVWIPTVPEMPRAPATAPPAAPAASQPVPADSTFSQPPQQLYRWIDGEGVANWTNNWEVVPAKYRNQAKRSL
jgi:hypothetical protein